MSQINLQRIDGMTLIELIFFIVMIISVLGVSLCIGYFIYYRKRLTKAVTLNSQSRYLKCYNDWKCNNATETDTYSPVERYMKKLYACRYDNFTTTTILEDEKEVVKTCVCPIKWIGESSTTFETCDNRYNWNPAQIGENLVAPDEAKDYGVKSCSSYVGTEVINEDGSFNSLAIDALGTNPCQRKWAHDVAPTFSWSTYKNGGKQIPWP